MQENENIENLKIPDLQLRMVWFFRNTFIPFSIIALIIIVVPWIAHWVGVIGNPGKFVAHFIFLVSPVVIFIHCIVNYPTDPKILGGIFKDNLGLALTFHYLMLILAVLAFMADLVSVSGSFSPWDLSFVMLIMASTVYPDHATRETLFASAKAKYLKESPINTLGQEDN